LTCAKQKRYTSSKSRDIQLSAEQIETMEEQIHKTKIEGSKNRRLFMAASGLIIFVVAVVLVTVITHNNNDKNNIVKTAVVRITKDGFQPATLSVHKGTKVVWVSDDAGLHQVASNPFPKDNGLPGLNSEILNENQNYTYTADMAGTFGYHDQINPTINGTLTVKQ
jgi:plastocyanin